MISSLSKLFSERLIYFYILITIFFFFYIMNVIPFCDGTSPYFDIFIEQTSSTDINSHSVFPVLTFNLISLK